MQIVDSHAHLYFDAFDADALARTLTHDDERVLAEIRKKFGDGIFDAKGQLNRGALRAIIFFAPQARSPVTFAHQTGFQFSHRLSIGACVLFLCAVHSPLLTRHLLFDIVTSIQTSGLPTPVDVRAVLPGRQPGSPRS